MPHQAKLTTGCSPLNLRTPLALANENLNLKPQWMRNVNYRELTFLAYSGNFALNSSLARFGFYLAEVDGNNTEHAIQCMHCYGESTDLEQWHNKINYADFKDVHTCFAVKHEINLYHAQVNYSFEVNRLISILKSKNGLFNGFEHFRPGFRLELARSGFYYKGPADLVCCVYCQLGANNWEENDVVDDEHITLSTDNGVCCCAFMTGTHLVHNTKIGLDIYDVGADSVPFNSENILPQYKHYVTIEARLNTFYHQNLWKYSKDIPPGQLAQNYFICAGHDRLICCKCALAIQVNGPGADPLQYHLDENPSCQ